MHEKKRLEHVLATDADLARRGDDINAYFDLAKEGKLAGIVRSGYFVDICLPETLQRARQALPRLRAGPE